VTALLIADERADRLPLEVEIHFAADVHGDAENGSVGERVGVIVFVTYPVSTVETDAETVAA
jgi:hypothetical protein